MSRLALMIMAAMAATTLNAQTMKTLHDFKAKTIDGHDFDFASLKGKKVIVVNTASKCGLTPQYEQLEQLYKEYHGQGVEIIGFPANNFAKQEPGTNNEIAEFCKKNYGVSFTMMEKVSVKGDDQHPIYQWLTHKDQNGVVDAKVSWNFQKFLIDEKGHLVKSISPQESPMSEDIVSWLKK